MVPDVKPLITLENAITIGVKRHFTGEPCINGHYSERLVSNYHCIQCCQERRRKNRRSTSDKRIKENKKRSQLRLRQIRRGGQLSYRIRTSLRTRLLLAVKSGYKNGSAVRNLGCSISDFKLYIEFLWKPGMSWDNWGRSKECWQLDHIRPLSSFDLENKDQLAKACHYTNIQPLWSLDNQKKGSLLW